MKRLIKINRLYDNIKMENIPLNDGYFDIYLNPTRSEINDIIRMYDAARCVINDNGDIYAWPSEILHSDIINKTDIPDGLRFIFVNNGMLVEYAEKYDNFESFKKIIDNALNNLEKLNFTGETKINIEETNDNQLRKVRVLNDLI